MTEHTALPWAVVRCESADGRYMRSIIGSLAIEPSVDPDGTFHDSGATVCTIYHEANAEFIVRAANSFDELVAELEATSQNLRDVYERHKKHEGEGCLCAYCARYRKLVELLTRARGEQS